MGESDGIEAGIREVSVTKVARALCAAVLTVVMVSCSNGAAKVAQIAPTPIATSTRGRRRVPMMNSESSVG